MSSGTREKSRQNLYSQRKFSDGSEVILKTYVLCSARCSTVTKIRNCRNEKKRPCPAHTHTQPHTSPLPSPPFSPSPYPVPPKNHLFGESLVFRKKRASDACAKGRTCAKCLLSTLWKLQKWHWLSRKFDWLVRLCRTEVRRPAGRKTRVEARKGQPLLRTNYRQNLRVDVAAVKSHKGSVRLVMDAPKKLQNLAACVSLWRPPSLLAMTHMRWSSG